MDPYIAELKASLREMVWYAREHQIRMSESPWNRENSARHGTTEEHLARARALIGEE
jgi:hypothetical protein